MGLIPTLNTFVAGTPIVASVMNSNFEAIVTVVNGGLDDSNISQISAGKVTSGEFDPDRIPRLSEDKLPQAAQGFLKAKGATADPAYELVQWGDVQAKPAQATRWPTWSEVSGKPSTFPPPSLSDPGVVGVLPVSKGGTNVTSLTGGRYIRSNSVGTAVETRSNFQVLSDIGAATADHTHSLSSSSIKDVLPVSKGGLGANSLDPSGYLVAGPFGDEVTTLSASSVRIGIGANNASNLSTGTVPIARLPVGSTNNTQVAPGQAMTGSGNARHPVGSIRLLAHSLATSSVSAGDTIGGVSVRLARSFSASWSGDDIPLSGFEMDATGGNLPGTWQALSVAGSMPGWAAGGNRRNPFLAVRVS